MEVAETVAVDAPDNSSLVHVDGGLYCRRVNILSKCFLYSLLLDQHDYRPQLGSRGSSSHAIIDAKGLDMHS